MWSANRTYLPRLDYIRGIAAWWVVAYHGVLLVPTGGLVLDLQLDSRYPPMVMASQGWLAVSIFVMVSGFSLGQGLKGHEINWSGYFRARWLRVAPLYLFMLALGILATTGLGSESIGSIIASITMLPLPGAYSPSPWMATVWSVRIEFMLYFALPALVYIFNRYSRRTLTAAAPLFLIIVFVLLYRSGAPMIDILYWGFFGRFVEFSLGFALGFLGISVSSTSGRRMFGIGGLAALIIVSYVFNRSGGLFSASDGMRTISFIVTACASVALLLWTTHVEDPPNVWFTKILSRMGLWSYSTYMWHFTVLMLVAAPMCTSMISSGFGYAISLATGLIVLILGTAVISWLSFTFVERPFLSLRPTYVRDAHPSPQPTE